MSVGKGQNTAVTRAARLRRRKRGCGAVVESEKLARAFFERAARSAQPESVEFLHPEAEVAPSFDPTLSLSPAELAAHFSARNEPRTTEAYADTYHPLDNERVIVEGQVVIRQDGASDYRTVVWAMVFRDGLLYRSLALSSVREAEARLGSLGAVTNG